MDLSRTVTILSTGVSERKVMVQVDDTKLGDKEDPYGLYSEFVRDEVRQAAQDFRDHEKSKDKLVGILRSMTNKELDEKINAIPPVLQKSKLLQRQLPLRLFILQTPASMQRALYSYGGT